MAAPWLNSMIEGPRDSTRAGRQPAV